MHVEHISPKVATSRWPAVVLPALALAALTWWVGSRDVAGWEVSVTGEVWSWPDGFGLVLRPAIELGNRVVAVVIAVVVGVRCGWRAGVVVAGGALGASLVANVLKVVVERPRISAAQLGGDPRHVVDGFSYPSSHAAVAFGVAVALLLAGRVRRRSAAQAPPEVPARPARRRSAGEMPRKDTAAASTSVRRWALLVLVGATLTAIGRMWLGVHHPLDVLGGALTGTTCALVAAGLVGRWPTDRTRPIGTRVGRRSARRVPPT